MTAVPVESDEAPNSVIQTTFFNTLQHVDGRLGVVEKASTLQTAGIIVQTVTNGDTDHSPSADAVYDFGNGLLASTVVDGDTTHAPTGNAVYDFFAGVFLFGSASLNFPNIPAGTVQSLTFTVTGAQAGDSVVLGAPVGLETGLIGFGRVSAADTVAVRLFNGTAAGIDPAAGTWKAMVIRV